VGNAATWKGRLQKYGKRRPHGIGRDARFPFQGTGAQMSVGPVGGCNDLPQGSGGVVGGGVGLTALAGSLWPGSSWSTGRWFQGGILTGVVPVVVSLNGRDAADDDAGT
jgi:hypothetical protein